METKVCVYNGQISVEGVSAGATNTLDKDSPYYEVIIHSIGNYAIHENRLAELIKFLEDI